MPLRETRRTRNSSRSRDQVAARRSSCAGAAARQWRGADLQLHFLRCERRRDVALEFHGGLPEFRNGLADRPVARQLRPRPAAAAVAALARAAGSPGQRARFVLSRGSGSCLSRGRLSISFSTARTIMPMISRIVIGSRNARSFVSIFLQARVEPDHHTERRQDDDKAGLGPGQGSISYQQLHRRENGDQDSSLSKDISRSAFGSGRRFARCLPVRIAGATRSNAEYGATRSWCAWGRHRVREMVTHSTPGAVSQLPRWPARSLAVYLAARSIFRISVNVPAKAPRCPRIDAVPATNV